MTSATIVEPIQSEIAAALWPLRAAGVTSFMRITLDVGTSAAVNTVCRDTLAVKKSSDPLDREGCAITDI